MNAIQKLPAPVFQYQPGMKIEQGIYLGMPEEVYFATNAISVSGLKQFRRAPALYRFGERETTRSQAIGKLWHTALLEPEQLEKRFMRTELKRFDPRMEAYKTELQLAAGRELIKAEDWEEMQAMCSSIFGQGGALVDVLTHPGLEVEVSFFWWDRPSNVFCRGRADAAIFEHGFVGDVKSCRDANADFRYAVRDWLYHWQAAFYKRGLRHLGIEIEDFVFFAVEKTKPFLYSPWVIPRSAQEHAEQIILPELERYRECQQTNMWPGYQQSIREIDYPAFWLEQE